MPTPDGTPESVPTGPDQDKGSIDFDDYDASKFEKTHVPVDTTLARSAISEGIVNVNFELSNSNERYDLKEALAQEAADHEMSASELEALISAVNVALEAATIEAGAYDLTNITDVVLGVVDLVENPIAKAVTGDWTYWDYYVPKKSFEAILARVPSMADEIVKKRTG